MIQFERHRKRNKTNKNLIIITIGFLCSVLVAAFVFQTYISKLHETKKNNPKILSITIENNSMVKELPYFLIIQHDTILRKTVHLGKQNYQIAWKWDTVPVIQHILGTNYELRNVYVNDSVSYIMVEILGKNKVQIIQHFFE
ncbi:MAG TPA: hypothetical protein P5243_05720 [Bacteroidales bacterium]|jgi:hypothetical protein|nr:hypothetical protein [Bacteroidales bacterium]